MASALTFSSTGFGSGTTVCLGGGIKVNLSTEASIYASF